jgi:hypothetical protein
VKYFDVLVAPDDAQKRVTQVFASDKPAPNEIKDAANGLIAELFGREAPPPTPVPAANDDEGWEGAGEKMEDRREASPTRVEPEYDEAPSRSGVSGRKVAGYSLLGVAVVSAGLSALSFVQIDRAQGNDSLHDYRVAIGQQNPMVKNVCDEAEAGISYTLSPKRLSEVQDSCSQGDTYEVLQYVFLGAAVVSGGLSAYFLLSDDDAPGDRRAKHDGPSLAVRPVLGFGSASLDARLRF